MSTAHPIWRDDFDGPAGAPPSPVAWSHDLGGGGWGCDQVQVYTDAPGNSALTGDGCLAITARREGDGAITSARLHTKNRVHATFGRVEARIRVPSQGGSWSAFWMLGDDIDEVGWPACGEIDVLEHVGIDPHRVHGTVHGPEFAGLEGGVGRAHRLSAPLATDFHTYAVEWSPGSLRWSVDGEVYSAIDRTEVPGPWRCDHPFFLILNVAIGGAWPGNRGAHVELPATMLVDWVGISGRD